MYIKLLMDKFINKVNDNVNSVRFLTFILDRILVNMEEIYQNTKLFPLGVQIHPIPMILAPVYIKHELVPHVVIMWFSRYDIFL